MWHLFHHTGLHTPELIWGLFIWKIAVSSYCKISCCWSHFSSRPYIIFFSFFQVFCGHLDSNAIKVTNVAFAKQCKMLTGTVPELDWTFWVGNSSYCWGAFEPVMLHRNCSNATLFWERWELCLNREKVFRNTPTWINKTQYSTVFVTFVWVETC